MRKIDKIIVHCSDSSFGDAEEIDRWHRARKWAGIGYHYVILNGQRDNDQPYNVADDGKVELGRSIEKKGAHCRGFNHGSIGICLIGRRAFTGKQLYTSLPALLWDLTQLYRLKVRDIYGHCDFDNNKSCPNINTGLVRSIVLTGKMVKMIKSNIRY